MNTKWSQIINSIEYQQLRNNDCDLLKAIFRDYALINLPQDNVIVPKDKCRQAIVDLYNKTYQLNRQGFIEYIENKLPKNDFVAVLSNY